MHVTLIGLGCGDMETITAAAQRALSRAEGIFGSRRLLEGLPPSVRNGLRRCNRKKFGTI